MCICAIAAKTASSLSIIPAYFFAIFHVCMRISFNLNAFTTKTNVDKIIGRKWNCCQLKIHTVFTILTCFSRLAIWLISARLYGLLNTWPELFPFSKIDEALGKTIFFVSLQEKTTSNIFYLKKKNSLNICQKCHTITWIWSVRWNYCCRRRRGLNHFQNLKRIVEDFLHNYLVNWSYQLYFQHRLNHCWIHNQPTPMNSLFNCSEMNMISQLKNCFDVECDRCERRMWLVA